MEKADDVSRKDAETQRGRRGEWIEFWESIDGKVFGKRSYADGNKSGDWVFYSANGYIELQGSYVDGKENG